MISAWPKIFAVGSPYIPHLFDGEVEITEKIDGSMLAFGMINGTLFIRSKGALLHVDAPEKMFTEAISQAVDRFNSGELTDGMVYFGEYLKKPKHNALAYSSIPLNHIALFGAATHDGWSFLDWEQLRRESERLQFDVVPLVYKGKIEDRQSISQMLERDSYLGGQKIEGVVIKNYSQKFLLGGQPMPLTQGKYVSESFKEVNHKNWDGQKSSSRQDLFFQSFKTEARWNKAIQHLQERGEFTGSPQDIGNLIKEIHNDITEEEKHSVMEWLWKEHAPTLLRIATGGFPEWFKGEMLKGRFE